MKSDDNDPKTVTLPQAAMRLRVPWYRAYNMLLQGELKGVQKRGRWYIFESDLPDREAAELVAP